MKAFLSITLCFIISCGKPLSKGADDELIVLTAVEDRDDAARILTRIFSDTLYTPAPEPYYKAKYIKPEDLETFRHHPNLIAISINDDMINPGTRLVKKMLSPDVYESSKNGNPLVLTFEPYAKHQTMLIINGRSTGSILDKIDQHGSTIYDYFENKFSQRQSRFMFQSARKEELEQSVLEKYGFSIKIPWGYSVVQDSVEAQVFWIGKEEPFRWLVVHWEEGMVIENQEDAVQFAKAIPGKLFDHLQYTDVHFEINGTLFNYWSGWRITGLWESKEESQGGPFIAYAFYDGVSDRTYYIHTSIYNPGDDKYLLMRQLDIIAKTFYTKEWS